MSPFAWGMTTGVVVAAAAAAAVGVWLYKRLVLLERRTQQAERLAEIGALTGGLAHEIKNPLSTVQLNLALLAEDLDPHNPGFNRITNRLNVVQRETSRLRDILEDFLRYAGRIELDPKPTDLNQLLEELVDFFSPQAQALRVQLRLRKTSGPVVARVDPKLLKQALLNLMLNGVQAMSSGGGEMILSVKPEEDHVCLDVIDTGSGIPPEILPRIFQAYYTTKRGGTGIGLAMTKRIVEEHGGTISVQSEEGKGTDFTIELPLQVTASP
ncbi:MAG TPA: ATP-binding protein [Tepidisphaeraceae bacterium]|jgi:signal transduction histidine kinase